jgi:hypothetical protein
MTRPRPQLLYTERLEVQQFADLLVARKDLEDGDDVTGGFSMRRCELQWWRLRDKKLAFASKTGLGFTILTDRCVVCLISDGLLAFRWMMYSLNMEVPEERTGP